MRSWLYNSTITATSECHQSLVVHNENYSSTLSPVHPLPCKPLVSSHQHAHRKKQTRPAQQTETNPTSSTVLVRWHHKTDTWRTDFSWACRYHTRVTDSQTRRNLCTGRVSSADACSDWFCFNPPRLMPSWLNPTRFEILRKRPRVSYRKLCTRSCKGMRDKRKRKSKRECRF